ncbi:hypothetical protein EAF04_001841 [Stromatinia cepivora]|nr:hypothetical protein EAF04_001841 [Stromatinia cepivora]
MANSDNEPDFSYRIYLQEQLSMDLHSNAGSVLLDSSQQEMLTQRQGDKFVDIGIMPRQSLMAWVYGAINELESFELHRMNLKSAAWSQLYKIIKNHDIFKEWIYSRPRTDSSGFVISLRDYTSHPYYSSATVLGYSRSVWQKIERDLRDENPTRFMKELFQQVFNLWHFKCCINNMLRDLRGLPPTTPHDTYLELTRYITPDIVPNNPNFPNPRPDSAPANIRVGGHSFNVTDPGSSPNGTAAANNQGKGRQSTYVSQNANNSQIAADARGKQHIDTNTTPGQTRIPTVKFERNTGDNTASRHIPNMIEASNQGRGYQTGSSLTLNASQSTEPNAGASKGPHIKQEVNDEHDHGKQAEGPNGWKQYIQQIIGVGKNQSVQPAAQSNSGVPSNSTINAGEIRKRPASSGSDTRAVPVHTNKKIKVEKTDPALAGHSST